MEQSIFVAFHYMTAQNVHNQCKDAIQSNTVMAGYIECMVDV